MDDKVTNMVEVACSISMSRSLYLELPEGMTKEQLIERAKQEIILPHNAMAKVQLILNQLGIRLKEKLDLNDWNVDEVEYVTN